AFSTPALPGRIAAPAGPGEGSAGGGGGGGGGMAASVALAAGAAAPFGAPARWPTFAVALGGRDASGGGAASVTGVGAIVSGEAVVGALLVTCVGSPNRRRSNHVPSGSS